MLYKSILYLLLLLSCVGVLNSRPKNIDSLTNIVNTTTGIEKYDALLDIAMIYTKFDTKLSTEYFLKALEYAHEINYQYGIGRALANYGHSLSNTGSHLNAIDTLTLSYEILNKINKTYEAAYSLSQIGRIYQNLSKYDTSLNYFIQALKLIEKDNVAFFENQYNIYNNEPPDSIKKHAGIYSIILTDYGLLLYYLKNFDEALEYFEQALELGKIGNNKLRIAGSYSNIAMIYNVRKQEAQALEYYRKALEIATEIEHLLYMATIYNNIGNIYRDSDNFQKAEQNYLKSLEYQYKLNHIGGIISAEYNLGRLRLIHNRLDKAFENLQTSLKMARENNILIYQARSYGSLATFYEKKGDFKNAYENYILFKNFSDSVFVKERIDNLDKLKLEYDTEKKLTEIKYLQEINQQQSTVRYYLIFLIILIFVIALILFYGYLHKSKVNKQLKEMNKALTETNNKLSISENNLKELNITKDKFFSIISHDLRSPLSSIISLSDLIYNNIEEFKEEELKDSLKEIRNSTKSVYSLLQNLLYWANTQTGNIQNRPQYTDIYFVVNDILDTIKHHIKNKNIVVNNFIPEHSVVFVDTNLLSIILRNIITNAIKFSYPGSEIDINAEKKKTQFDIIIRDYGVGIPEERLANLFELKTNISELGTSNERGTGLGLVLVSEFAKKIDAKLEVESEVGKGTKFIVQLPQNPAN